MMSSPDLRASGNLLRSYAAKAPRSASGVSGGRAEITMNLFNRMLEGKKIKGLSKITHPHRLSWPPRVVASEGP